MTSPGNQHCASCIGTISFPMGHDLWRNANTVVQVTSPRRCVRRLTPLLRRIGCVVS